MRHLANWFCVFHFSPYIHFFGLQGGNFRGGMFGLSYELVGWCRVMRISLDAFSIPKMRLLWLDLAGLVLLGRSTALLFLFLF
jgi:hypothetical protein